MLDQLFVHVGTEKTGTSSIQRVLHEQRESLAKHDVLYPTDLGSLGGPQILLTAACLDFAPSAPVLAATGIATPEAHAAHRETIRAAIHRQVSRGFTRAIVSDEHINVHLAAPNLLTRLADFFDTPADRVVPVIYLRRQDRLLESMLSEALKNLSTRFYRLDDPASCVAHRAIRFDYPRIVGNLCAAFGENQVIALASGGAEGADAVHMFAQATGLPLESSVERVSQNATLPGGVVEAMWPYANALESDPTKYLALRSNWRSVLEYLASKFPGPSYRLSRQQADSFLDRFQAGNSELLRRFPRLGPAFENVTATSRDYQRIPNDEVVHHLEMILPPDAIDDLISLTGRDAIVSAQIEGRNGGIAIGAA